MFVAEAADLTAITPGNLLCKYADDTYIIIPDSNSHTRTIELVNILIHGLNSTTWHLIVLKQWRSFLLTRRASAMPPTVTPDLPGITRCTTLKILGVTITNGLSMAEHYDTRRKIIMFTNPPCTQSPPCPRHARLFSSRSFPSGGHCQTMLCIQCLVGFLHSWGQSASNSLHPPQYTLRLLHYGPWRHHELYRYSRWHPVPPNYSYQPKSRLSAFTPRKS